MENKAPTFFVSLMLAFTLSCSAAFCLATGFSLTVASPLRLMLLCGIAALGGSLLFLWNRGSTALALMTALLSGYLWHLGTPEKQLLALIQTLSQTYDSAYHWGSLHFTDLPQSADYPLMILAYLVSVAVCRCVCRGKGSTLAVTAAILPGLACFVVTDTVPHPACLLFLMAGVGILLLTGMVRRQNVQQGNRLAAMAAVPVFAGLLLLFWLVPQGSYVNRSAALREQLLSAVESLSLRAQTAVTQFTPTGNRSPKNVELASLGRQIPSGFPVMRVTADTTGSLYLRGWDCDEYTGTGWRCSDNRSESFTAAEETSSNLTIATLSTLDYRFVPYYSGSQVTLSGGMAANSDQETEYRYATGHLPYEEDQSGKYGTLPDQARYLALPEHTRLEAEALLSPLLAQGGSNTQLAARIAGFVRSSAQYDLDPGTMPPSEPDFALWFLKEADRGYCIHFATAATVLLRSAGIPARYVTGYLTHTHAGETVTVTGKDAHAWAEYYEPRLDAWLILEATPSDPEAATHTTETIPETTAPTAALEEIPQTEGSVPSDTDISAPPSPPPETPLWLKRLAALLGIAGLLVLALTSQRHLRIALRGYRTRRGSPNAQALALWREAERLHRLLGEAPGEELIFLAQKAKFSQHDLSGEELEQLRSSLRTCRRQLRRKPWYIRLLHQYIYAAY